VIKSLFLKNLTKATVYSKTTSLVPDFQFDNDPVNIETLATHNVLMYSYMSKHRQAIKKKDTLLNSPEESCKIKGSGQ